MGFSRGLLISRSLSSENLQFFINSEALAARRTRIFNQNLISQQLNCHLAAIPMYEAFSFHQRQLKLNSTYSRFSPWKDNKE